MRIGEKEYWEKIIGRVIDSDTKEPVAEAAVKAYDKDMLIDDFLGEAKTDEAGKFFIEFSQSAYQSLMSMVEGRPDIYLEVTAPGGKTVKTKVHDDMDGTMEATDDPVKGGPDGEIEILDMGDVEV